MKFPCWPFPRVSVPLEIPGVSIANFIRAAIESRLGAEEVWMRQPTIVASTKKWIYCRLIGSSLSLSE